MFLSTISNIHIVNTNKLTPKERQQSGIAIFLHVQPLHDKKLSLQSCTCDNSHFFSNSMSNLFFKPSIVAISSFSRSCRLFYTTQSSYLVVSLERIDLVNKLISQPSTNQNKRKKSNKLICLDSESSCWSDSSDCWMELISFSNSSFC